MSKYFIKDGYTEYKTDRNLTFDTNRKESYWDANRELSSKYYQWGVYQYIAGDIKKNDVVVDIGCGCGYKLHHIIGSKSKNIIGLDQPAPIQYCQNKYMFGKWIDVDFESPNFVKVSDKVDYLICSDVIEHLINPEKLISFIHSIISYDTKIIFSTPDRDRLRGYSCMSSEKPEHVREWNFSEFKKYIENNNFKILSHFHQTPLRFTFWNYKVFFTILLRQLFANDGRKFKYNQVVVCRKNL
ncbi:Methyltransferase domain-containing protein [Desulfonatronum thiosulfatophilum]|uniref:Methyltransferase domain-containing protein n=1 Tax=Desulfonatronum thiosulfatophilum TaxID=617002 RepID=A0A1G6EC57_9BACT|nr:class I SAM-dependent methyltransferase [Desulfonatronum thiosulfatophilum]SDB54952.1 Methyltransferase domain-containing protein [Desulfonatronum thiosulfatophilum]